MARIGFTNGRGVMRGTDRWQEAGQEIEFHRTVTAPELASRLASGDVPQILDVRDPLEWDDGHIPGSVHCYVPELLDGPDGELDPDQPVWAICRTGSRASVASGLLHRLGFEPVVVASGGVPDLL